MHWKSKAGWAALLLSCAIGTLRAEDIPIPPHQPEEIPPASLAGYPDLTPPAAQTNTTAAPTGNLAYPVLGDTNAPSMKSTGAGMALHPGTTGAGRQRPALWNSVNTSRKVVALTFDDGPHGKLTPQLLDLLQRENVRATFFVLGSLVEANPQIVQRMAAEGHEVANHTWNHPRLPSLSREKFDEQIRKTTEIIERNTGKKVTTMRPTYGLYNERVKNDLLDDYGLDIILWSVDPNDWKKPGANVVARRLVEGAHPGAILLAHDIHPGTIAAMPRAIADLKAKGYEFATVTELLAMDEPEPPEPSPTPAQAVSAQSGTNATTFPANATGAR
ncbi:MAG: polysaccharide deacetylase family protein [Chthoniobacterales bacterium]